MCDGFGAGDEYDDEDIVVIVVVDDDGDAGDQSDCDDREYGREYGQLVLFSIATMVMLWR